MPIPLPGDGRPVLTLDELLERLQAAREVVGGEAIAWVSVPGQMFHLPVWAAETPQVGALPEARLRLRVLT